MCLFSSLVISVLAIGGDLFYFASANNVDINSIEIPDEKVDTSENDNAGM